MSWGYGDNNGPSTWYKDYPLAESGKRQSPIDIIPRHAVFDKVIASNPIVVKYQDEKDMAVVNTGKTVKAKIKNESIITGGPLKDNYQLAQFHLHWGSEGRQGSEHTIDGKQYAAELHMVHWNLKYQSIEAAMKQPDGLVAFGILLEVGEGGWEGLKPLASVLDSIKQPGGHGEVKGSFNPKTLLPEDLSKYWTYPGSLTTPPLYESVTWIVFEEVLEISRSQLESLRALQDVEGDNIVDNYRPPRPLGDRTVRTSFNP